MTNGRDSLDTSNRSKAIRRLNKDLTDLDSANAVESEVDSDMLSLIIDEILSGENISIRYPAFYKQLLNNAELRQAFIDMLESVEAEHTQRQTTLPGTVKKSLPFLSSRGPLPILEILDEHKWRSTWRSTLEQIRAIFSPREMAYRADASALEDPWFTLLRDEINAGGIVYAVALECTLSSQTDDSLTVFLDFAITLATLSDRHDFPIQASLHWGEYEKSILITEQGRSRFPDIPLISVMDKDYQNIKSGLSLSLEATPDIQS